MKFLRFLPAVLAQSPFENVDCNLNCAQGVNCCENQNSEIQPELEDAGKQVDYECDDGSIIQILDGYDPFCNGITDCEDQSDEHNCAFCAENQFSCDVNGAAACLSESHKCDGFDDCDGGADEKNCNEKDNCRGPKNYWCEFCQSCVQAAMVCAQENIPCSCSIDDYYYGVDYENENLDSENSDFCQTWDLAKYQTEHRTKNSAKTSYLFSILLAPSFLTF